MSRTTAWSVRFAAASERDIRGIYEWTQNNFGAVQADKYAAAIEASVVLLETGPKVAGVRERNDVAAGVYSLRIKMKKRQGRHLLYFRVAAAARDILIVRVLHDAMDTSKHIPTSD